MVLKVKDAGFSAVAGKVTDGVEGRKSGSAVGCAMSVECRGMLGVSVGAYRE